MIARKFKIKAEERSAVFDFFKKAKDNYQQMISAWQANNFNAAGTLALQCVISGADAICIFDKGIRSISDDHFDVCDLVASLSIKDAKEKSKLLRKIIAKKSLIQYERRNIYQEEASEIVKIATRFYQWVRDCIE